MKNRLKKKRGYWCPDCKKPMKLRDYIDHWSSYLGSYRYRNWNYWCSICERQGQKFHCNDKDHRNAYYGRMEYLLKKNYPPDKYEYLTTDQAIELYNHHFSKRFLESERPIHFRITTENGYLALKKSLDLICYDSKNYFGNFSLQVLADYPIGFKEEQEKLLWQYLPPDKYEYISWEELVKRDKDNKYWHDLDRLKDMVYSLEIDGKRKYLVVSHDYYLAFYYGLFYVDSFVKYGSDLEPDEGEEDED